MNFRFTEIDESDAKSAFIHETGYSYSKGRVYAIEIDGNRIKVGVSGNPTNRFNQHISYAKAYGFCITRFAVSDSIAMASILESAIRLRLNDMLAVGSKEVFNCTMDQFLLIASSLELSRKDIYVNSALMPDFVFTKRELEEWASANGFRREYKVLRFSKSSLKKVKA